MNNKIIHRGEIVRKAVKNSGIKISELSRKLGKSRRFIYNMFDKELMPFPCIKKIGMIINYNFSNEIPELEDNLGLNENEMCWKDKYINLLEEHHKLLKEYNEFIKKS